jgi:DNA-directed RNA polymerase specialized sigma24 family protein
MPQTTEQLIATKLDQLLRIVALMATRDLKQRDRIAILNQAGLQPKDIANLLGTSSNTVRVELVALRKSRSARKRKATESA